MGKNLHGLAIAYLQDFLLSSGSFLPHITYFASPKFCTAVPLAWNVLLLSSNKMLPIIQAPDCHFLGKDFLNPLLSALPTRTLLSSGALCCPGYQSTLPSLASSWTWPCFWLMGYKWKCGVGLPRSLLEEKQTSLSSYLPFSYYLECRCNNWNFWRHLASWDGSDDGQIGARRTNGTVEWGPSIRHQPLGIFYAGKKRTVSLNQCYL